MTISVTNIGTGGNGSGSTVSVAVPAGGVPAGALIVGGYCEANTNGFVASFGDSNSQTYNYWNDAGDLGGNAADGSFGGFYLDPANNTLGLTNGQSIIGTKGQSVPAAINAFYATGVANAPYDKKNGAHGSGTAASSGSSGTPTQANELVVGLVMSNPSASSMGFSQASGGWLSLPGVATDGQATIQAATAGGYIVQTTATAETYSPTIASAPWGCLISSFKAAAVSVFAGFTGFDSSEMGSLEPHMIGY